MLRDPAGGQATGHEGPFGTRDREGWAQPTNRLEQPQAKFYEHRASPSGESYGGRTGLPMPATRSLVHFDEFALTGFARLVLMPLKGVNRTARALEPRRGYANQTV